MDDLISRAAAIAEVEEWAEHGYEVIHWTGIKAMLEVQPDVDAAPVVYGRWIDSETGLWQHCSVCGVAVEKESMFMCKASEDSNFNYCPNCGAKMIGDANGTR